jgi:hypothetical protein
MKLSPPFVLLALLAASPLAPAEKFVVHEWGVQVIGRAQGGPVLTAPDELLGGLPGFVGRNVTPLRFEFHGWDKPVIHFYGREGMDVSVKVGTPVGVPLAFFPPPKIGRGEQWGLSAKRMMAGMLHFSSGMEWHGRLRSAAPDNLPTAPAEHWWNTARTIPSSYFETTTGSERFVFYEATAAQKPVIASKIGEGAIELKNSHDTAVGPVVIVVNDGTGVRGVEKKTIGPGEDLVIAKADLKKWTEEETLAACRRQWRALGMTEAESAGIVEVWKSDLVARLGVLVIAPMPEVLYNKMFPLEIVPKPDEIVRAGLVFDTLTGQDARRHWLPALNAELRKRGDMFESEKFAERTAAQAAFRAAGDLGLEVLAALSKSEEPEVRRTAKRLAKEINSGELRIDLVRPTKENSTSLVEQLTPPSKSREALQPLKREGR